MFPFFYNKKTGRVQSLAQMLNNLPTGGSAGSLLPGIRTVIDGDSITALDTVATHRSDRGWFNWMNAFLGQSFNLVLNAAVGGQRSDQVLARIDAVLAVKADFGFLMVGVNDFSQGKAADFTLNNVKEYVRRMNANGTRMVVSTATPTSKWTTADQKLQYYKYNRMLKEWARTQSGLILIDMGSAYLVQDATAAAANHTVDETHPSALGAVKMGKIAAAEMVKHINRVPSTLSRSKDDPENLIGNGVMFGNTGTITKGTDATINGVAPDGWILGSYVAGTVVTGSKVANVDYPGEHLHVSQTTTAATGNSQLYREISPTSQPGISWAPGDKVYAQMEIEVMAGVVTNLEYGVDCKNITTPINPIPQFYGMFHESQAPNLSYPVRERLTLRTPAFDIPPNIDRLRIVLKITGNGIEYKVYLAEIRKV